jgi:hypothetical protein
MSATISTLTGYQEASGTSTDNSTTDTFLVAGPLNQIISQFGNLSVTGITLPPYGQDTQTAIDIGGGVDPSGNPTGPVTDTISLHGFGNVLDDSAGTAIDPTGTFWIPGGTHDFPLLAATVSYTVAGTGGLNYVNLDNIGGANTIKLGGNGNTVSLFDAATNAVTFTGSSADNTVTLTPLTYATYATSNTVTATGSTGGNVIEAVGVTNKVTVGGTGNTITLNGDATNTVSSGSGGSAVITIGAPLGAPYDDDLFGYKSSVTLGGSNNTVTGGDENFTITGGKNNNVISLGDGNSNVLLSGTGNSITVWGGTNSLNAGGSNAVVNILGLDGVGFDNDAPGTVAPSDAVLTGVAVPGLPQTQPDPTDDGPVPVTATDFVTIAGTNDVVNALVTAPNEFANVIVSGSSVTSAAQITLGDGANQVILGGTGSTAAITQFVTAGNGNNTISAAGNKGVYTVGYGDNAITLSGNSNTVNVVDPFGYGFDTVKLGAGANDTVNLDYAGGSVTGTATTGVTTVTQSGPNSVTVNLNNGTGNISLGAGSDTVTANGNGTIVTLGAGSSYATEKVTANGSNDTITVGDASSYGGSSTISALTLGTPPLPGDTITVTSNEATNTLAGGNNSTITFNNTGGFPYYPTGNVHNTVTVGSGDNATFNNEAGYYGDTNTVTGGANNSFTFNDAGSGTPDYNTATVTTGSSLTFNSVASSVDKFTVGASGATAATTTVAETNGTSIGLANGPNDVFLLNGVNSGSTLSALFGNEKIAFGLDSSDKVSISTAATNDVFTVQADTTAGSYGGNINITGFANGDTIDLQSLVGAVDHKALTSYAEVKANWTQVGGNTDILLKGGGSILLNNITIFTTSGPHASFAFTGNYGAVGAV